VELGPLGPLGPDAALLVAAVALDLLLGDPVYRLHPIRLMGAALAGLENVLRRLGADGYFGGILLFLSLAAIFVGAAVLLPAALAKLPWVAVAFHIYILFSMIALGDLRKHVFAVDRSASQGDAEARQAIAQLVGRDTSMMDAAACRRAAIESFAESLVDGFMTPIFWYALLGLPGLVTFKVVSTMDSMVGYKTDRYRKFGWCGARLDDAMNWIPARLSWLFISLVSFYLPGGAIRKGLKIGWKQHGLVPGPNAGWSEATAAGALQFRLVGPIWRAGELVTEIWLGDPTDPAAGSSDDVRRAALLMTSTALLFVLSALAVLPYHLLSIVDRPYL